MILRRIPDRHAPWLALRRSARKLRSGRYEASCHSERVQVPPTEGSVTVVVISSDGEGDRSVESLEGKVPEGWGIPVRSVQGGEQTGRP